MVKPMQWFNPRTSVGFLFLAIGVIALSKPTSEEAALLIAREDPSRLEIDRISQDSRNLYVVANALAGAGRMKQAIRTLERLIWLDPDHPEVIGQLVAWLKQYGFTADSLQSWVELIQQGRVPRNHQVMKEVAEQLIWSGKSSEARWFIEDALKSEKLTPEQWKDWIGVARALADKGTLMTILSHAHDRSVLPDGIADELYFQFQDLDIQARTFGLRNSKELLAFILQSSSVVLGKNSNWLRSWAWNDQNLELFAALSDARLLDKTETFSWIQLLMDQREMSQAYSRLEIFSNRTVLTREEWRNVAEFLIRMKKPKIAAEVLKALLQEETPRLPPLSALWRFIFPGIEEAMAAERTKPKVDEGTVRQLLGVYDSIDQPEESIQLLREISKKDPSPRWKIDLAHRLSWSSRPKEALQVLRQIEPENRTAELRIFEAVLLADSGNEEEARALLDLQAPISQSLDPNLRKRVSEILRNRPVLVSSAVTEQSFVPDRHFHLEAYQFGSDLNDLNGILARWQRKERVTLEYAHIRSANRDIAGGTLGWSWQTPQSFVAVDIGGRIGGSYRKQLIRVQWDYFVDRFGIHAELDSARLLFANPASVDRGLTEAAIEANATYRISKWVDVTGLTRGRALSEQNHFNRGYGLDTDLKMGFGPEALPLRVGPWWYRTRWTARDPSLDQVLLSRIELLGGWTRVGYQAKNGKWETGITAGYGKDVSVGGAKWALALIEGDASVQIAGRGTIGAVYGHYGDALSTSVIRGNHVAKIEARIRF